MNEQYFIGKDNYLYECETANDLPKEMLAHGSRCPFAPAGPPAPLLLRRPYKRHTDERGMYNICSLLDVKSTDNGS